LVRLRWVIGLQSAPSPSGGRQGGFPHRMSAEVWGRLAGLGILALIVLINAYFVSSEYGLVASRRSRIEQLALHGNNRARLVHKAQEDLNPYISATQVGITIAGLALGYLGEPVVADLIRPLFAWLPEDLPIISAHAIAIIFSFLIVTYVTVLFS